jgi:hypothetical protein
MKRTVFAAAVLAVALPAIALAGEPVPMSDSEMDNTVAAGFGLSGLNFVQANALIRANQEQFRTLASQNSGLFFANEALVRRLLDDDLERLLPARP